MKVLYIVIMAMLLGSGILHADEDATQSALASFLDETRRADDRIMALVSLMKQGEVTTLKQKVIDQPEATKKAFAALFRSKADWAIIVLHSVMMSNDKGAYEALRKEALQHVDRRVRAAAFGVAETFNDQAEEVANAAVAELRLGEQQERALGPAARLAASFNLADALHPLLGLLSDSSVPVRLVAAQNLLRYPSLPPSAKPILEKALADNEGEIKKAAVLNEFLPSPLKPGELSEPAQLKEMLQQALSKVRTSP